MDVRDWLRSLGLSEYEPAFRDNQIDSEVLPKLTRDDLKELGVAAVGDRRKLLSAIAELSGTFAEPAAVAKAIRVDTAAERRQLTVMFCDLVGSTAISARLDPEDLREMMAAYHQCCASLIERGGGFVAKYMGDGVLGYFGYPQAHEHDAERAVRAGLEIVKAAPKLQTAADVPLHVRVGIATGIVIVGDLLGSGEAQEREVVGNTPNLAARLQGIAEPDTVVIAEDTRKLLGELFELVDLGPRRLKGVAGTTQVFVALRERSQTNRFEALHPEGLSALVGRDAECELLLQALGQGEGGQGPSRTHLGRGGHWQIQADGRISGATFRASRTRRCAISARPSTPTARSTRSSATSSGQPTLRARTMQRRGSTSSKWFSLGPQCRMRTARFWPRCCPFRTTAAIPHWTSLPINGGRERLRLWPAGSKGLRARHRC